MINHRFWKTSIAFLTVLVLAVLALTGCGKSAAESGTSGALQSTEAAASAQAEQEQNPAETAEPAQPEPNRAEIPDAETGHTNIIVVYFSATGHTEPLGLPCGKLVLSVAVLSILLTAPLGALGMDATKNKFLSAEECVPN